MHCKFDGTGKSDPRGEAAGAEHGFALLQVLGFAALVSIAAIVLTNAASNYLASTRRQNAEARLAALADAGAQLAAFDLLSAREDAAYRPQFNVQGEANVCQWPGGELLTLYIEDEGGKADLNFADEETLLALLEGLEVEPDVVRKTIAVLRPAGARGADHTLDAPERDAGVGGRVPSQRRPLVRTDQLQSVYGLDAGLVDRLRPYVTVYSGRDSVDLDVASPAMRSVLSARSAPAGEPSAKLRFKIRARVTGPSTSFERQAIVDLSASRTSTYRWREWGEGWMPAASAATREGQASPAPPCL